MIFGMVVVAFVCGAITTGFYPSDHWVLMWWWESAAWFVVVALWVGRSDPAVRRDRREARRRMRRGW